MNRADTFTKKLSAALDNGLSVPFMGLFFLKKSFPLDSMIYKIRSELISTDFSLCEPGAVG